MQEGTIKKQISSLTKIFLSLCMVLSMCVIIPQTANAEESKAQAPEIQGDYMNQYFSTLLQDNQLKTDSDSITFTDNNMSGVYVAGTKDELTQTGFYIDKTLNFDSNPVSRIRIDALSVYGCKVSVACYMDDETTPIATFVLPKQKKKKDWTVTKDACVDISSLNLTGEHKFSFKIVNPTVDDGIQILFRSIEFMEYTVPTVSFDIDESEGTINEMNSSEDHSAECYGSMTINVPDGFKSEYTGKQAEGGTYQLEYIRGRGNSTWMTNRKPYKIKLDSSSNILGMGKNKHWVLLANYYDNSMLRNKITYWLGEQLGMEYTPKSEPVEVVMNGEYYGTYFLCEQVRVGKTRVNIDDLEKDDATIHSTDPDTISGGYLISMDEPDNDKLNVSTNNEVSFALESPKFEDYYNEAQHDYIKNYLQATEDAINGKDFKDKNGKSYTEYLDLESAVNYIWLQEFSNNGDAFGSGSTYLYKKRGGKLFFGPLWDFDYVAWGSTEYTDTSTNSWGVIDRMWFKRLFEDKEFCKAFKEQWTNLKQKLNELIAEGGQLDKYKARIEKSVNYNVEKFGMSPLGYDEDDDVIYDESDTPAPIVLTYDQEIERLRTWITDRENWVDTHVEFVSPQECTLTYKVDGKVYATKTALVGKTIGETVGFPKKDGYIFTGWETSYHLTYDQYLRYLGMSEDEMEESYDEEELADLKANGYTYSGEISNYDNAPCDITLTATFKSNKSAKLAKSVHVSYSKVRAEIGSTFTLTASTLPMNTDDDYFYWTSSDENVVTVEGDGSFKTRAAGKATVTAINTRGMKASCTVEVLTNDQVYALDYNTYETIDVGNDTFKMKTGQSKALKMTLQDEEGYFSDYSEDFYLESSDTDVLEVNNAGVIHAVGVGTATVRVYSDDSLVQDLCTVTVTPAKGGLLGQKVIRKNVSYQITGNNSKSGYTVMAVGIKSKKAKTVTVKKKIKYNGRTYKVTEIGKKAFAGCKKLKKVKINAKKLYVRNITFKKLSKKLKVVVPKKSKAFYKKMIKCRKVK